MDWDAVIIDISPRLYDYFRVSFPAEIANDMVQDTLIRLVKKYRAGEFDETKGSIRMFAFGIAHFIRLETFKSLSAFNHSNIDSIEMADPNPGAEAILIQSNKMSEFREALNQLTPLQREVVLLLIDENLSLDEISKIVNQPTNTVKSHIHRAKESLKKLLIKEQP